MHIHLVFLIRLDLKLIMISVTKRKLHLNSQNGWTVSILTGILTIPIVMKNLRGLCQLLLTPLYATQLSLLKHGIFVTKNNF